MHKKFKIRNQFLMSILTHIIIIDYKRLSERPIFILDKHFTCEIITPVFILGGGPYTLAYFKRTVTFMKKQIAHSCAPKIELENRYRFSLLRPVFSIGVDFLLHFSHSSFSFFVSFSSFKVFSKHHLSFAENPKKNHKGNPEILTFCSHLSTFVKQTIVILIRKRLQLFFVNIFIIICLCAYKKNISTIVLWLLTWFYPNWFLLEKKI